MSRCQTKELGVASRSMKLRGNIRLWLPIIVALVALVVLLVLAFSPQSTGPYKQTFCPTPCISR